MRREGAALVSERQRGLSCVRAGHDGFDAFGGDAAGALSDLDQFQLPFVDETVDRGSGDAEHVHDSLDAIQLLGSGGFHVLILVWWPDPVC